MENISKLIKTSISALRNSQKTFADIYAVMFSHTDKVMVERDEGFKETAYTYGQVDALIKRAAFSLKALGLNDKYIGVYAKADLEWIVLFWAILMSGNKPFLMNANLADASLDSQLKTLAVDVVATDKKTEKFAAKKVLYDELIGENVLKDPSFGNSLALSTSGTGLSEKICVYTGKEMSEQILNAKYVVDRQKTVKKHYKGRLKLLTFLPFYHIFGLTANFFWFAFFGRTFVSLADYSAATLLRTIKKYKVTHIFAVPLFWQTIEKNVIKQVKERGEKTEKKFYKGLEISLKLQSVFPSLGRAIARKMFKEVNGKLFGDSVYFCVTGGSYIKTDTLKLINGLGYQLHNGYGMSETGITSFEMSSRAKDRVTAGVGKPFPTVEYKINEEGVLLVKGKTTCNALIIDGKKEPMTDWFYTGDIVRRLDSGAYEIVGRKSDLVIGDDGENLSPDVIEKHFDIEKATAFSVLGDKDKKSLIMVVRIPENAFSALVTSINDDIDRQNKTLPLTEQVKKVYYTFDRIKAESDIKVSRAKLARDIESGKVRIFTIDELFDKRSDSLDSEIGKILLTIFAKTLNVDENAVAPDKNFFTDLGGTSLDYFNLVAAINEKFSITLQFDETHLAYTLAEMEQTVKNYLENKGI